MGARLGVSYLRNCRFLGQENITSPCCGGSLGNESLRRCVPANGNVLYLFDDDIESRCVRAMDATTTNSDAWLWPMAQVGSQLLIIAPAEHEHVAAHSKGFFLRGGSLNARYGGGDPAPFTILVVARSGDALAMRHDSGRERTGCRRRIRDQPHALRRCPGSRWDERHRDRGVRCRRRSVGRLYAVLA